jgi:hypothetical protein
VCGVLDASVSPDGSLYFLGKTTKDNTVNLYKMSQNGGAFISTTNVGWRATLNEEIPGAIHATSDSGCILFINHNGWSGDYYTDSRHCKILKHRCFAMDKLISTIMAHIGG